MKHYQSAVLSLDITEACCMVCATCQRNGNIRDLFQCLHPKPQTDRKITDQMKRFCHRLFSVILLDFLLQLFRQKTIDGICYICKAKAISFVHIFPWTCMLCYLTVSNLFSSLWRLSHYVMSK